MRGQLASRRNLIGAVAVLACVQQARAAAMVPEAATLIAPGPEEGLAADFATQAARGLARGLAQATSLRVRVLGGADGVTAANRFAASTPADGRLLLTFPGLAAQALLIGDSRARFEPRLWPAVAGSIAPALLAGDGELPAMQPVRIALPGPAAPEAASLLALDLLGRNGSPVFVPPGTPPEAALRIGAADAIVLSGPGAPARAGALGLRPWFVFDGIGGKREQELADVPTLSELLAASPRRDLLLAVRAAGAAIRACGLLVLPRLTSADAVALWRDAARRWTEATGASTTETRRIGPDEAAATLAMLCPPPEAALGYRDWLARRFGFQTS
jgi:hypothetical protein